MSDAASTDASSSIRTSPRTLRAAVHSANRLRKALVLRNCTDSRPSTLVCAVSRPVAAMASPSSGCSGAGASLRAMTSRQA